MKYDPEEFSPAYILAGLMVAALTGLAIALAIGLAIGHPLITAP